jgi:site-specific recombinase XerD
MIDKLIIEFLEYLEIEKGRATTTAKNYDHYLKTFALFAKNQKIEEPSKITSELVTKYRLALNRSVKIKSKSTQNYYLIALRSFLKYLGKKNIQSLPPEQIELAKTDERQITFLDHDELDRLLLAPDLNTLHGKRDRAILDLLFSTGLRVSELANLKKKDINSETGEFSVKGKGGKVRVVFIDERAKESLKKYLQSRNDQSEFLFISYGHANKLVTSNQLPDTSITPRSIQRMIKKYATSAGITKKVSPHTFRHSFATDLLMSGADLRAVQSLLGHSSVTTTQIYTHVTDQHLKEVHQAFHGRRRKDESTINNSSPDS